MEEFGPVAWAIRVWLCCRDAGLSGLGFVYLGGCPTNRTHNMVRQVCSSPSVQGFAPLQGYRGVVELSHDGAWSRGGAWGGIDTGQRSNRERNHSDEPRGSVSN